MNRSISGTETGSQSRGFRNLKFRQIIRKLRNWAAYGVLFFGAFFVFIWLSLPTRSIAWKISQYAKSKDILLDVKDVSISPFGNLVLHEVVWIYEPSRPGQIPSQFYLDRLDVDVSLWRLLWGDLDIELESNIEDARLYAHYTYDDQGSTIKINIEGLPLEEVPKLRQAVNTSLGGLFTLNVDLTLPNHDFTKAEGNIDIACSQCSVGNGEDLLYVPGVTRGLLANGITIPAIDLGSLGGRLVVREGNAQTEEVETESDDIKLKIAGWMTLKNPIDRSAFEFQIKIFLTQALLERSEAINLMAKSANPNAKLAPPEEGWLGFKLRGNVRRPEFMGINTKSREELRREKREQLRQRDEERAAQKRKRELEKQQEEERKAAAAQASEEDESEPAIEVTREEEEKPVNVDEKNLDQMVNPLPPPPAVREEAIQPQEENPEQPENAGQKDDENRANEDEGRPAEEGTPTSSGIGGNEEGGSSGTG